ncbi:hypothetical protein ACJJTC_010410 [Scirpophaga incertulas]
MDSALGKCIDRGRETSKLDMCSLHAFVAEKTDALSQDVCTSGVRRATRKITASDIAKGNKAYNFVGHDVPEDDSIDILRNRNRIGAFDQSPCIDSRPNGPWLHCGVLIGRKLSITIHPYIGKLFTTDTSLGHRAGNHDHNLIQSLHLSEVARTFGNLRKRSLRRSSSHRGLGDRRPAYDTCLP